MTSSFFLLGDYKKTFWCKLENTRYSMRWIYLLGTWNICWAMEKLLGRPQDKARQMKAENYCSNHNKTRKISCNLKKLWIWFVQKTLQKRLISFRRTVSQNLWLEIKLEKKHWLNSWIKDDQWRFKPNKYEMFRTKMADSSSGHYTTNKAPHACS